MQITKFGHCCLLIEENNVRIITDPGVYSSKQDTQTEIDIILITHEHPDHFHIDSVKRIKANNPTSTIITNSSVGKILEAEGLPYTIIENGQTHSHDNVTIVGVGNAHATIYSTVPVPQNTGYLIANRFFYPGDSLTVPKESVDILALPVAGPWLKIAEAIDYALEVNPHVCFPVHDGIVKAYGSAHSAPPTALEPAGISWQVLELGTSYQF